MGVCEDYGRKTHYHKCPKTGCDKRVKCTDKFCNRKSKYCDEHKAK